MRTSLWAVRLAVVVVVVASVTAAMAQGQGRRGQGRGGRGGAVQPLVLLQNADVQKELTVTDQQKTQIDKLVEDQRAALQAARGQGAGGFDPAAAAQRAEETQKKINEILLAPQQDRLAQIVIQVQGVARALAEAKVAEKLGLTAEQKEKLTALQTEYQQKRMDLFQGGGPPDAAQTAKLTEEEISKAKDLLTADQKSQLAKLEGKILSSELVTTLRAAGRGQFGRGGAGAGAGAGGQGRGRRGQGAGAPGA